MTTAPKQANDSNENVQGNDSNASMEEILHSIRKIIANEPLDINVNKSPADKNTDEDVLELTEIVSKKPEAVAEAVAEEPAPVPKASQNDIDAMFDAPAPAAETKDVLSDIDAMLGGGVPAAATAEPDFEPIPVAKPAPTPQADAWDEPEVMAAPEPSKGRAGGLLSDEAAKASESAIRDLLRKMPDQRVPSPAFRSGATLEDLVIETLRPVLSEWLDAHLPQIVKQAVEKEIKRIIPRDE